MEAKWYDFAIENAKGFIRSGEQVAPVLFLLHRKQRALKVFLLGGTDKDEMVSMMRMVIKNFRPDEYFYLTEAYVRGFDPKNPADTALGELVSSGVLAVSELNSRQECLVIVHGDRRTERIGTIIFHRKDGKLVKFDELQWADGEAKGRMTGLRRMH